MLNTLRLSALFAFAAMLASAPAVAESEVRVPPNFESPEVTADRKITFRLFAPNAKVVRVFSGDIPGAAMETELTKGDDDVWAVTVGPVPAGAYRYIFLVDGVAVVDPRNPVTSELNMVVHSMVVVPGSEIFDCRNVPHGGVAEVVYHSQSLDRERRMHVYTPPGYGKGDAKYPVLYLFHGALDCDDSWTSIGRAGFILDNLIAAGKAKPMVVVMPAGHTGPFVYGPNSDDVFEQHRKEYFADFNSSVRPFIEANYRVKTDRGSRAIAGLSMGGVYTLDIAFADIDDYAYVGVFSSGVFKIAAGFGTEVPSTAWEDSHKETLDNVEAKKGLKLVWFGIGDGDFLLNASDATVEMLRKHGFEVEYKRTEGGHTWLNWRDYFAEFASKLFRE